MSRASDFVNNLMSQTCPNRFASLVKFGKVKLHRFYILRKNTF